VSLPRKDIPLSLPVWAHTILGAKSKRNGATLKRWCEAILEREAAKEAMDARYLAAQMEANGVEPSDWERAGARAGVFDDSAFDAGTSL
jgi:hypothetical protein